MTREMKRLLRFARPYWAALLVSIVLMATAGAGNALLPVLVGRGVFDRVLNPKSADVPLRLFENPFTGHPVFLNDILPGAMQPGGIHNVWTAIAVAILLLMLIKGLTDYLGNYVINYVGISAVTDVRQTIFENLLKQDSEFFESQATGHIMSSVMNDIEKIQLATSSMLADWLRQSFVLMGLLYVLLTMDWKLGIVSVTVLPFVLVPTIRIGRRIRRTTRRAQDTTAELNQILQETISGHQVVKSFGTEVIEARRFRAASRRLRSANLRYVLQQALASPLIELFGAVTIVALLTYARNQIKLGHMTIGEFTTFVMSLLMLYEPVKRLNGIHNIFQQASGASQKVFEYLDRAISIKDKPGAIPAKPFRDSIGFRNVTFRYPTAPNGFMLYGIDLVVNAGEVVALVGPSGAGKTTLANLVPRFYDVSAGAVLVDGYDIRDLQLASLRRQIGIVSQDTFLFNDTVANNISYGNPAASLEKIIEAAKAALADEFICGLEQGYDTLIGERGVKLSGGQRQRLAIARALLKNAPILILDEATSHLDTESELLVQKALANLMEHRTVIVIAHRLSTIRRADKIVVLDQGRISEVGTHDDLITHGGIYQRLHELQFLEPDSLVNP